MPELFAEIRAAAARPNVLKEVAFDPALGFQTEVTSNGAGWRHKWLAPPERDWEAVTQTAMRHIGRVSGVAIRIAQFLALQCGGVIAQSTSPAAMSREGAMPRGRLQGTVRTDTLWAQSLGIRKALTVYLPPSYEKSTSRRYPVLFYLHGYTGNERNWVEQGALARMPDRHLDAIQSQRRSRERRLWISPQRTQRDTEKRKSFT